MSVKLQFSPFSSAVDASFWHQLCQQKLEVYKLNEAPHKVVGYYTMGENLDIPARLCVNQSAFVDESVASPLSIPPRSFPSFGVIHNTNTVDAFKDLDKKALLDQMGSEIWDAILSGDAVKAPAAHLNRFLLLTFADLKKYHFYYWFAFPALSFASETDSFCAVQTLSETFSEPQIQSFHAAYDEFRARPGESGAYFLLKRASDTALTVHRLSDWDTVYTAESDEITVGFADPCALPKNPGWPLRNLLLLLSHWKGHLNKDIKVVCFREASRGGNVDISQSIVLSLKLTPLSEAERAEKPKVVGWEKNAKQKLGPRIIDLSASMDPARLAETAVDLNLKLMRWRLLPALDLEKVASTKCLLVGAGTLGCNVARVLLGWGVRNITLVDNGKISFSNPVRQSLFEFNDCLQGGKPKAETAAESLKRIFPGVNAVGLTLSIPMPGHVVEGDEPVKQTRESVAQLEKLISEHDAVFLLMDTRESRWLPTLIGNSMGKIVINSALGFDSFVVMRHGVYSKGAPRLGCYFCNDVMAPANSTKDRTLDQQCTVARPGISFLASSMAVELLVSLLHHPLGVQAPAASTHERNSTSAASEKASTVLGLVPHQIRGFLSQFDNVLPVGQAFDKCTACSATVVEKYRAEGFAFLHRAFNSPTYLEDITGLSQLHSEAEAALAGWEEDIDDDDGGDMESGENDGESSGGDTRAKAAAATAGGGSADDDDNDM